MLFLSGPMGAGKSTVARIVGARLGLPVVDLDAVVEARLGCSIAAFFQREGERAFRAVERDEALKLATGCVVALGGGAVTDATTRRALLARGTVVTLMGSPGSLAARIGDAATRPLLRGRDAASVLATLLEERADAYAECHGTVSTDGRSPDEVADAVLAVHRDRPVVVPLGRRTYRVEIGAGVRARVGARAAEACAGDVLLVHDGDAVRPWPAQAAAAVTKAGRRVVDARIPAGEEAKRLATVERIWDVGLDAGLDRRALVLAVGGGVVGDMAAFAASTLLRGVAFGQLPTTLLSMVDSSVGGKTGFNTRHGKNLVGTFYQPRFVLCDIETLETLPTAERIAGLAEVVKSAWLDGEGAVAQLEQDAEALRGGEPTATERAVRMSVGLKARIVAADETESGDRMLLNLGHTVGHAIEARGGYAVHRHGEAVALGLVASVRVGRALGSLAAADEARLVRLMKRLGLPHDLDAALDDRTLDYLGSDKKKSGDRITFIVPGAPGDTRRVPLTREAIERAVRAAG